jgi:hypothetical protein
LDNVAIGYEAGNDITTGDKHVYIGSYAGQFVSSHQETVGIGYKAAEDGCSYSAALGAYALLGNTGSYNVAVGHSTANGASMSGSDNVIVGSVSGIALTSGYGNTMLGDRVGQSITAGGRNILLGYRVDGAATTDSQIRIGDGNADIYTVDGIVGGITDIDVSAQNVTVSGTHALPTASTNLNAGDLILQGGVAATTGAGVGGDVKLQGGAGGSTGTKGNILLDYATWPSADGGASEYLQTDGAGNLTWAAASGGWDVDDASGNLGQGSTTLDSLTSGTNNVAIGDNAGTALTIGSSNVFLGTNAGDTSDASYSVYIGHNAGNSGQTNNVAIGYQAGNSQNAAAKDNVLIGYVAGDAITSGSENVAIGHNALTNATTSSGNIAIGKSAASGLTTLATENIVIGADNHGSITTGDRNISIGETWNSDLSNTGDLQIAIGYSAQIGSGRSTLVGKMGTGSDTDVSGENITLSGTHARFAATTNLNAGDLILQGGLAATTGDGVGGDVIVRGGAGGDGTAASPGNVYATWPSADGGASEYLQTDGAGNLTWAAVGGGWDVDDDTNRNYGFGPTALNSLSSATDNVAIGYNAATNVTSTGYNVAIGSYATEYNMTSGSIAIGHKANRYGGSNSVHIGFEAGMGSSSSAVNAIGIGYQAYRNATGSSTGGICIGYQAGESITTQDYNIAIGYNSMQSASGSESVAIGKDCGTYNSGQHNLTMGSIAGKNVSGSYNVLLGPWSGEALGTGSYNTCLGYYAGQSLSNTSNNIIIGRSVGSGTAGNHDQIIIGHKSGSAANAFVDGNLSARSDVDYSGKNITVTGPSAFATASTNLNAGDLILQGGLSR